MVGVEVKSYVNSNNLKLDKPGKRCWTVLYADNRHFHMDILPAIPDELYRRNLLESSGLNSAWSGKAIAITDVEHKNFTEIDEDWPHSNPKGYSEWFKSRGGKAFTKRQRELFEATTGRYATSEEIPQFRVKSPLQGAIQILKRHRDAMFEQRKEHKPISIIISTLSAHSYNEEDDLSTALFAIIAQMDRFIEDRDGVSWISNPVDELENFADKWENDIQLESNFREWLETAREDFDTLAGASTNKFNSALFESKFGKKAVSNALIESSQPGNLPAVLENKTIEIRPVPPEISRAPHKQMPPWPIDHGNKGKVEIVKALAGKSRWKTFKIRSNDPPLPKNCSLWFTAQTNVSKPYEVHWQIVNTGNEAKLRGAGGLRGGLEVQKLQEGGLFKKERTLYRGSHSIECFIVKNGYLSARSGTFVINIE